MGKQQSSDKEQYSEYNQVEYNFQDKIFKDLFKLQWVDVKELQLLKFYQI